MSGNTIQQMAPYRTWIPPEGTDEKCWSCWQVFKSGEKGVLKHPTPAISADSHEEALVERAASVARERLFHGVHRECAIPWAETEFVAGRDVTCGVCRRPIDISTLFSPEEISARQRVKIVKKLTRLAVVGATLGAQKIMFLIVTQIFTEERLIPMLELAAVGMVIELTMINLPICRPLEEVIYTAGQTALRWIRGD